MNHAESLIEFVLSHVSELKSAVVEKKMGTGGGHTGGTGGHAFVSDPTASTAIRLVVPVDAVEVYFGPSVCGEQEHFLVRHPEQWLRVAEHTKKYFTGDGTLCRFYDSRYNENDHWTRTCQRLKISRGNYYSYRKEVIYYAALFAVHEGILEPSDGGLLVVK